jgi:beta-glucosidase
VEPHRVTSLAGALREQLGDAATVEHEPGCRINRRPPALARGLWRPDGSPGVEVAFFEGATFEGPSVVTKAIPRFELRWIANSTPVQGQFSLRATSVYTPERSGEHRFTVTSAGLSRLLIDGELVIDNWSEQQPGTSFDGGGSADVSAAVALEAGSAHELVLEYQTGGRQGILGVSVGCEQPDHSDLFERAVALAGRADHVVLVGGLSPEWEAEGSDRRTMSLPGRQDELIAAVLTANPNAVVVLNAGSPIAMPWIEAARAVLQIWYPGQEGGEALADVLLGAEEPGGRLPTTLAARIEDHPSHLTYPGEAGQVSYGEGIFVGYRAFERLRRAPLFPFGHGFGYSTFQLGVPVVNSETFGAGESVIVRVPVRNTGGRAGSTVVQVYVRDVASSLLRPEKELAGFAKIRLAAGDSMEVAVELPARAFEAWDPRMHGWVAEPGEFEILVGQSSADLAGSVLVTLSERA